FTMLWNEDIPRLIAKDDDGRTTEVTVIAGALAGLTPPPAPPSSWASRAEADLAIWHIVSEAGARWTVPAAANEHTERTVYVFEGSLGVGEHTLEAATG